MGVSEQVKIRNKTTNVYTEWKPLIDSLSDEDAGKIFKNIFSYQSGNDINSNNPVWMFIKAKIDEYNANGVAISEARSNAGKIGMAKRWGKITSDNKNNNCYQMLSKDNKNNNKIKENKYIFNGITIKLNENDYNGWKEKYNLVDLDYELEQIDCWFQEEKNSDRKKDWFWIVQKSLAKKQKEKYDALPKGINGKPIQNYHEW